MGPGPKLHQARRIGRSSGSIDAPLVIYGLLTGILAVGAGVLVGHVEPQFGGLAPPARC
jgi:hypothetical protein